jgi:damage-control phosphatase, subfamily I
VKSAFFVAKKAYTGKVQCCGASAGAAIQPLVGGEDLGRQPFGHFMKTSVDCVFCFFRQTFDSLRAAGVENGRIEVVAREVAGLVSRCDFSGTPVSISRDLHRIIRSALGVDDPFYEHKRKYNALLLGMYPRLKEMVDKSSNPFDTAARLAIAGNVIDFGAKGTLTQKEVFEAIDTALHAHVDGEPAELERAVAKAKHILYLADNAGEVVLDRLLIEQMPRERVTLAVRGGPTLNDVLMEDAEEVGLTRIVRVLSNGVDAPGTLIDEAPEEMKAAFAEADLVVSKGQGNYETVAPGPGRTVFYLLKVKCEVIARNVGCPMGTLVMRKAELV